MATIHLMHGYIGFGKTTTAKRLAKEYGAVRLDGDAFMAKLFGRNPYGEGFGGYWDLVRYLIWDIAKETIENGIDVIIDYGFWRRETREKWYKRAKEITPDVVFHVIQCDMKVARERTLLRTKNNPDMLEIDENCFDIRLKEFEPICESEGYKIIYHDNN